MMQISYFPYFPKDDFNQKFGRVHLFNFWQFKEQYIMEDLVREQIEKICSLHVNASNEKIKEITIAVIDDRYDFSPLNDKQLQDLQRYALVLFFCTITNNIQNRVYTSEHFQLYHQNFKLDEDAIVFETGSILRVHNWQNFEMTRFVRPLYIEDKNLFFNLDVKLLTSFAQAIDKRSSNDEYIYKVLEWVRYAYINVENFSYESRIVMLATAFEILFKLPSDRKTEEFARRLEGLLNVDEMLVDDKAVGKYSKGLPRVQKQDDRGQVRMYKPKGVKQPIPIELTVYGWWARDFYGVRSKIVHEGIVSRADLVNHNDIPHFKIAIAILNYCFYRLLEDHGYLIYEKTDIAGFENFGKIWVEGELRKVEEQLKL